MAIAPWNRSEKYKPAIDRLLAEGWRYPQRGELPMPYRAMVGGMTYLMNDEGRVMSVCQATGAVREEKVSQPAAGAYENIADFINRNKLQDAFRAAVSGDRTIEQYMKDTVESQELVLCILNDLSGGKWADRVTFSPRPPAFNFG